MPTQNLTPSQHRRRRAQIESEGHDGPIVGSTQPAAPEPACEVELTPDAAVADDHRNPRRPRGRSNGEPTYAFNEGPEVGVLVEPTERDTFANIVLSEECKGDVDSGLRIIT